MKSFLKIILQYYLKYLAKLAIFIHKPVIIAVAGSTNKSFVKNEIKKVLESSGKKVWANRKSFNTEIGLPLSILRMPSGYGSYRDWLPILGKSLAALWQKNYPEYIILELGVSKKGDMKYLLSIFTPTVSIVTDITQRYLESFSEMDSLVGEYRYLVEKTPKDGLLILNDDNSRVRTLAKFSQATVATFGTNDSAQWQASAIIKNISGQSVTVKHEKKSQTHETKTFGLHNVYVLLISLIIDNYFQK